MNFLQGIRVIDLSQFLPGPFATQLLSDMGADVVKVEPPSGDPMRALNPITNKRGPSPYHALVNAGKRVTNIDLKSETGKSQFKTLILSADVLLESYRPGVMDRLGLDWETLQKWNPKLIHCALSGYGQNGPLRLASGHDINYVAAAGQLNLTGDKNAPHTAFPMVADYAGALQAALTILGALVGRGTSGKGAFLDVSMTDAVLAWQSQTLAAAANGDHVARDMNLLTGGAAFYQVYECSDHRYICLGAIEEVFWKNFCDAMERPEWIERQHDELPQEDLISDVSALFAAHPRDHWQESLGNVDCCFQIVPEPEELAIFPQHQARKLIQDIDVPEHPKLHGVRFPAWVDGQPPSPREAVRYEKIDEIALDWGKNQ